MSIARKQLFWLVLVAASSVARAEEGPELGTEAPMPRKLGKLEATDLSELKKLVNQLQASREALRADRETTVNKERPQQLPPPDEELLQLRQRFQELLVQLAIKAKSDPAPAVKHTELPPAKPPTGLPPKQPDPPIAEPRERVPVTPVMPVTPVSSGPLDALALGNSLFSLGDYESAVKAYRQISLTEMRAEERVPLQYLIATCLRLLGKTDEAANLYREVAAYKADEFFSECAQWQVTSIRWRQDLESRIKNVQARRQALGEKK